MTPTERFTAWRDEILAEIATAEAELDAARSQLSDAEAVAKAKAAETEEMVQRVREAAGLKGAAHANGTVRVKEPVAGAIRMRLDDMIRSEKRQADGDVAQAKGRVENLEFRLENLRDGLRQALQAVDPPPSQAAAPSEPTKPAAEEAVNGWPA